MRAGFVLELARVIAALPAVEAGRRRLGPRPLVERLRRRGATSPKRDPRDRALLRAAIARVDALLPGGGCYRRVLLEVALDGGAARETLSIGLDVAGGRGSGHVWLGDQREGDYDAELVL
jgi:hypothetical protein